MSKNTIYFHLGFPKAASSLLQKNVFPYMPNIRYLGKFYGDKTKKQGTPLFDAFYWKAWEFINEQEKKLSCFFPEVSSNYNYLISDEDYISSSLVARKKNNLITFFPIDEILGKLESVVTKENLNIKLIILTRRQDELIESLFAQAYKKISAILKLQTLSSYIRYILLDNNQMIPSQVLSYYKLREYLIRRFGSENVLFLPYELILNNPQKFATLLAKFTNSDPNLILMNLVEKVNVRQRLGRGKLLNNYPLSTRIGKRFHLNKQSCMAISKFIALFVNEEKYINLSKEDKKIISNYFREDNLKLIKADPVYKNLGYEFDSY